MHRQTYLFPLFFLPSFFSASAMSKPSFNVDHQWNYCPALPIFLVSLLSPQRLSWKQQCVCMCVRAHVYVCFVCVCVCMHACVFQSIPKAEPFITLKLSQEGNVCFIVYVSTYFLFYPPIYIYAHVNPFKMCFPNFIYFSICERMCVIGQHLSHLTLTLTTVLLRWMTQRHCCTGGDCLCLLSQAGSQL